MTLLEVAKETKDRIETPPRRVELTLSYRLGLLLSFLRILSVCACFEEFVLHLHINHHHHQKRNILLGAVTLCACIIADLE